MKSLSLLVPIIDRGSAALAAFRTDPRRFDLVLTDEIMAEMTGTELARAVHALRPDVPVVLMTGEGNSLEAARLQAAGIREILQKPVMLNAMADCLARLMGRA
jgi:DNA-binding NtrC family response regulator